MTIKVFVLGTCAVLLQATYFFSHVSAAGGKIFTTFNSLRMQKFRIEIVCSRLFGPTYI